MKYRTIVIVTVAAIMSACNSEKINEQLGIPESAIILNTEGFSHKSGNDKTSVNDNSVQWVSGDEITINGNDYSVTLADGKAYIDGSSLNPGALYGYYACNPVADGNTTNPTVTVPCGYNSYYDGNGRQVISLPMVAYSSAKGNSIKFQHVTAAIKVKVKNEISGKTLVLDRVTVSSTAYKLGGTVPVLLAANATPVVNPQSGNSSVTVYLTDSPTIEENEIIEVQVPILPIGNEGSMIVEVYTHENGEATHLYNFTKEVNAIALGRNVMLTAGCLINTNDGHFAKEIVGGINSKFTINSNGDKVYFSRGNLQYQRSSTGWRFAERQWHFAGDDNIYVHSNDNQHLWIDLLNWRDNWGYRINNGGYTPGLWRNLTNDEWICLFNRTTGITINSTENASYTLGNITTDNASVSGIILFPDNYSAGTPSGVIWGAINNNTNGGTVCTAGGWAALEKAGCVFLPCAGYRGQDVVIVNTGLTGYYWTSTHCDNDGAYGLTFHSNGLFLGEVLDLNTIKGCSVRLVKDAN